MTKNNFLVTPYDEVNQFDFYTFSELFTKIEEDEAVPELKDTLVFIGIADGVLDMHKNARGNSTPGVLFHASIASNIMRGDFISPLKGKGLFLILLIASLFSLFMGLLNERLYLLNWMNGQRFLSIFFPLSIIGLLSYYKYSSGEEWRLLAVTGLELCFLLPIAVIKFNRKVFNIPDSDAVDLSKQSNIQYTILTQAPRPMALSFERHLQVTSDKSQHASTVFEERVVRFLGFVHLATLFRSGAKIDDKFIQAIENDTHNFQRPLAAGTCIGFSVYIRKVLKSSEDFRAFHLNDPNSFRESFLKERQAGGHYDLGNKSIGRVSFDDWLISYWNTLKFRMFVYLGKEISNDESFFVYEYLGGTQRLGKQRLNSEVELEVNHIYLINKEGYLIDLFPFILYRPYVQTQSQELLEFYQLKTDGKAVYKTLNGSESEEIDDPGIGDIVNSWKKLSVIKKELPRMIELQNIFNDDLKPWGKGDHVLNEWYIEEELMRHKGSYWYIGKRLFPQKGLPDKCLLNFYLKGSKAFKELQSLTDRLDSELDSDYVLLPRMYSNSSRGFWVEYPYGTFVLEDELKAKFKSKLIDILNRFHHSIGPQHLLSSKSFVAVNENGLVHYKILPGQSPETYGQKGTGLERMLDKLKRKELKDLERLLES